MSIVYPDDHCILNITRSLCKGLGLYQREESFEGKEALGRMDPLRGGGFEGSLPELDRLDIGSYKNLVLFVVDGMGLSILEENGRKQGFFQSHLLCSATSVIPSTTVAATTAFKSGRWPIETGWLGWSLWVPSLQEMVAFFKNSYAHSEEPLPPPNCPKGQEGRSLGERLLPFESLTERAKLCRRRGRMIGNFLPPYPEGIDAVCELVEKECALPGPSYLYAYVKNPDYTMHRTGVHSQQSIQVLREIEDRLEKMCMRLKNTLVLITADHGHRDVQGVCLQDYPLLADCFPLHPHGERACSAIKNTRGENTLGPALDVRTLSFFVREEARELFEERFLNLFGEDFLLYPTQKALEEGFFGPVGRRMPPPPTLGDYVAFGVGDRALYYTPQEKQKYIGHHSGLTEEEMRIPLLAVCS